MEQLMTEMFWKYESPRRLVFYLSKNIVNLLELSLWHVSFSVVDKVVLLGISELC